MVSSYNKRKLPANNQNLDRALLCKFKENKKELLYLYSF